MQCETITKEIVLVRFIQDHGFVFKANADTYYLARRPKMKVGYKLLHNPP